MGVLQVFDTFFEDDPSNDPENIIGRMYWTPVPYLEDPPRIIESTRAAADEHKWARLRVADLQPKHFSPSGELPIHSLGKKSGEEMVATIAKKRPVVILASCDVPDTGEITPEQRKLAEAGVGRITYLAAPFYSVSTAQEPGTFGPELVRRIRRLQYPHLFCVPRFEHEDGRPGSVIRLDRTFACHLGKGTKNIGKRLHPEILEVLQAQFAVLTGAESTEAFYIARDLAQEALD